MSNRSCSEVLCCRDCGERRTVQVQVQVRAQVHGPASACWPAPQAAAGFVIDGAETTFVGRCPACLGAASRAEVPRAG